MEQVWAKPEYVGLTTQEKIDNLNRKLENMYKKEELKSNPDFERVFLQFNFGANIGLYKANTDLTGWSKLTIDSNSDTATVSTANCN